jgi:hypothetical protein
VEADRSVGSLDELFAALSALDPEFRLFFTLANADAEGRALNERIKAFVTGRPNAIAVASLGQLRYISLMNQVDAVVGNSSSGVYEAPSLNAPSVDIGDRQKAASAPLRCSTRHRNGRPSARPSRRRCAAAGSRPSAPMATAKPARRIADGIAAIADFRALLQKGFHDIRRRRGCEMTGRRTLIIAEAGVNHSGSLETALALVDAAADAGADIREIPDLQRQFARGARSAKGRLSAAHHRRSGEPARHAAAAGIAASRPSSR